MNDSELNDLLRKARVPDRPGTYWEQFPAQAAQRAAAHQRFAALPTRPVWRMAWGLGLAAACVALGFIIGLRKGRDAGAAIHQQAGYQRIFHEVAALFPERLSAIVIEDGQVQLILADDGRIPPSEPLLVEICKDGHCRTFITFSGQQVRLNGDTFDVLRGGEGNVIVAGRNQVWIGGQTQPDASGLAVKARLLEDRS